VTRDEIIDDVFIRGKETLNNFRISWAVILQPEEALKEWPADRICAVKVDLSGLFLETALECVRNMGFEGTTNLTNVHTRTRVTLRAVSTGFFVLRNRIFETGKSIFRSIYGRETEGFEEMRAEKSSPTKGRRTHFFEDWEGGRVVERSRERRNEFSTN